MPPVSFLARVTAPASNSPPSSWLCRRAATGMMRAPAGVSPGLCAAPPVLAAPCLSLSAGCALALGSIRLHAPAARVRVASTDGSMTEPLLVMDVRSTSFIPHPAAQHVLRHGWAKHAAAAMAWQHTYEGVRGGTGGVHAAHGSSPTDLRAGRSLASASSP